MKKIFYTFFFLLTVSGAVSQNPVRPVSMVQNSIPVGKDSLFHYYLSMKPTETANAGQAARDINAVEKAALQLPSDSFALVRGGKTLLTVMLTANPDRQFVVRNKITGKDTTIACEVNGQLTESRSLELINNGYDPNAGLIFNQLHFNKKRYSIIKNDNLENAVGKIVMDQLSGEPEKKSSASNSKAAQ